MAKWKQFGTFFVVLRMYWDTLFYNLVWDLILVLQFLPPRETMIRRVQNFQFNRYPTILGTHWTDTGQILLSKENWLGPGTLAHNEDWQGIVASLYSACQGCMCLDSVRQSQTITTWQATDTVNVYMDHQRCVCCMLYLEYLPSLVIHVIRAE